MRVFTGILLRIVLALAILAMALWGTLALFYRAPGPDWVRAGLAGLFALAALAGAWGALTRRWRLVAGFAALLAAHLLWWSTIRPSHERDWAPVARHLPQITVEGGRAHVRNVRHFDWRTEKDFTETWDERSIDLARIRGVDLFLSYWTGPAIAHLILSFDIEDDQPLAFSIEIRREVGEEYSAIAGFFKQYELAVLAADERDIVRLRTDVWREDVRLYRLRTTPEKAREWFLAMAREVGRLNERPAFYNTLGGNCTTLAFRLARTIWPDMRPDWRVLLSGYLPDYLYELGSIDTRMPFEELKAKAAISEKARAIGGGPDFSARIREGVPKPPPRAP